MLHHFGGTAPSEAPRRAEHVESLEDRGLSLSVAADEEVLALVELDLRVIDVAEPPHRHMHNAK
jgi:hypothetical protein